MRSRISSTKAFGSIRPYRAKRTVMSSRAKSPYVSRGYQNGGVEQRPADALRRRDASRLNSDRLADALTGFVPVAHRAKALTNDDETRRSLNVNANRPFRGDHEPWWQKMLLPAATWANPASA